MSAAVPDLWVYEHEWNCIPPRSDFIVLDGHGVEAREIARFSEFDHGYVEARRLADEALAAASPGAAP